MTSDLARASVLPPAAAVSPIDPVSPQATRRRNRRVVYAAVGATVVAALVAVGVFLGTRGDDTSTSVASDKASASKTPEPLVLEDAYGECITGKGWKTLTLGDEGHSIIIDTGSEYGSVAGVACVMVQLGTSEAIVAQMDSTTSMMGVQQASDGDLNYQWSYHPDNGINMVITDSGQ